MRKIKITKYKIRKVVILEELGKQYPGYVLLKPLELIVKRADVKENVDLLHYLPIPAQSVEPSRMAVVQNPPVVGSGKTLEKAIRDFKDYLIALYDSFRATDPENLASGQLVQYNYLHTIISKRDG